MFPQLQSLSELDSLKQAFSNELASHADELAGFHEHLEDAYAVEALEEFEEYIYNIGTWFNEVASDDGNLYYGWVNRSKKCRRMVDGIVERANEAAYGFQEAREKGYRRSFCRRHVQNLIIAIRNLSRFNAGRKVAL